MFTGSYFITVPKNDKGYQEYDIGIEHTENMEEYALSPEEYRELHKNGVFRTLENELDVYISDGESCRMNAKDLQRVYMAIDITEGVFMKAVKRAIELGTCMFLDF